MRVGGKWMVGGGWRVGGERGVEGVGGLKGLRCEAGEQGVTAGRGGEAHCERSASTKLGMCSP